MYFHIFIFRKFPISFLDLSKYIQKNIKSYQRFVILHRKIGSQLFSRHKWHKIMMRKRRMIYCEEYMKDHNGKRPEVSMFSLCSILLFKKPEAYKYDFEILPCQLNESVNIIINYFKFEFRSVPLSFPELHHENPIIKSIKSQGDIMTLTPLETALSDEMRQDKVDEPRSSRARKVFFSPHCCNNMLVNLKAEENRIRKHSNPEDLLHVEDEDLMFSPITLTDFYE